MKRTETIIIGGGISGLACGNELYKAGKDFVLLTEELGGRMLTSKTHTVDYGASYITGEYKNTSLFIDKGERLRVRDLYFSIGGIFRNIFHDRKIIFSVARMTKFLSLLNDFRKRLNRLRKKSLYMEQKEALKDDPVLQNYLQESVEVFVKKYHIEYLNEVYFNPVVNSTAFVDYKHTSVFYYLGSLMPLIAKTYVADFRHTINRLTHDWKEKIILTTVSEITRFSENELLIKTSIGDYSCKNVVLALPYKEAEMIYKVPKPKHPGIQIYVFHVVGKRKVIYREKKVVFFKPEHHEITILWKQKTGSDIIFSKVANPDLEKYYESDYVVQRIHWATSVVLSDEHWISQDMGDGVFLASDYNLTGLEDAYITGVYAANRIIRN